MKHRYATAPSHPPTHSASRVAPLPRDTTPGPPAARNVAPGRRRAYEALAWPIQAVVSMVALILFSPLIGLLALLIKLSTRGPVLYRGRRVGQDFRVFTIYKFRTLRPNAEQLIGARLLTDRDKADLGTPIGRFLKRSKLDELPQLLNVVRGDMRLVGPRPVRPIFLDTLCRNVPAFTRRFAVPPGLTGIAQLRGGYYTPPRNKLRYDLIYIRRRSLVLDAWLVLLTVVKILNRWLSSGVIVVFLFLLGSFVPAHQQPVLRIAPLGIDVTLLTALLGLLAACILLRTGSTDFSLYRSPLNVPIFLFIILSIVPAFFAEDPSRALPASTYYLVTGFLTAFVTLNTLLTSGFVRWTVRVIALTSAFISLLGLFQIFLTNHGVAVRHPTPPSSILDDPVILAVYLVLGIPLLLSEVTLAAAPRARDLWLVCTTISFVGVFLTQTRVGLAALLLTVAVFLLRRRTHALEIAGVLLLCALLIASLGAARLSPSVIAEAAGTWLDRQAAILSQATVAQLLVGTGVSVTAALAVPPNASPAVPDLDPAVGNMHVTLLVEHGLLGWLVTMWLIVSTIATIMSAHRRAKDERSRTLLWAIASSLIGYVVSMASTNTFHHLPIQVFFWGLIGIGLGIVARMERRGRANLIWRFGASGD
jgi:lipopolysaccharide/colanic/teichoic acid biosynthesis glycosyltransferase